ncbi:MAG: hypothetical protein ABJA86_10700 [Nocardioidaceae bacterium]
MTGAMSRFETQRAPCGGLHDGERSFTEDLQGLATEELRYSCGCRNEREEFHDGSVHHKVVRHDGKVLVDEEFRGE